MSSNHSRNFNFLNSQGNVRTNILVSGGFAPSKEVMYPEDTSVIEPEDVAQTLLYLLEVPANINISQLTVRPVAETF